MTDDKKRRRDAVYAELTDLIVEELTVALAVAGVPSMEAVPFGATNA